MMNRLKKDQILKDQVEKEKTVQTGPQRVRHGPGDIIFITGSTFLI